MNQQVLDKLSDGVLTTDKRGRINYFNFAAERITGLSASAALGLKCKDIFQTKACDSACPLNQDGLEANDTSDRDVEIIRANGETIPVILTTAALRDQHGEIIGALEIFRDLSDHRVLEKSLFESERKLSTLISNLPGMAYRCINDRNWTMEFISEGCFDLTGYRSEDLIGNRTSSYNALIHPEDQSDVWEQIQEAVAERRAFQLVYRLLTASGEEKCVWEQGRGIPCEEGEGLMLEGFITDITASKQLEDKLRLSESKYRRIFEGSKDMIFLAYKDGKIHDVNQAGVDILKYSDKQELLSLDSIEDIYAYVMHWKVFQRQIDWQGFVKDFESVFRKKDGTRIHCLLSGNAIRDFDGQIVGYEGIAKDITPRIDATRNLQQRNRELQLLNSVALAMNRSQELSDILNTALKSILEVLSLTRGAIFLVDHAEAAFELKALHGFPEYLENELEPLAFHDQDLMRSLLNKDLCLTPEPIFPPFRVIIFGKHYDGPTDFTCFLITAKNKASGFIALDLPPGKDLNKEQDFHLLGSLGNFLGGAIENARLLQTVNKHREELKELTARLFSSQEKERRRIARELHDEAGQSLTGINFALETVVNSYLEESHPARELIAETKRQINRTYQEMRRISYRLHPSLLIDMGLEPALESFLSKVPKHTEMKITFKMVGFNGRLQPELETALYRISQEAITNATKHSRAKHFKLSIIKSFPHIIFLAEDDGVGFKVAELGRHRAALGLLGMRERVSMLGGSFSVRSFHGQGTRIRIKIPFQKETITQ